MSDIEDSNYDWDNEKSMKKRKQAYNQGIIIEISDEKNEKLLKKWAEYFRLLRHKDEADGVLNMAKCVDPLQNNCTSIMKLTRNSSGNAETISFTTSSFSGHPCYSKSKKQIAEKKKKENSQVKQNEPLPNDVITECKEIILHEGTLPCIIDDIRPFSFSEGTGFKKLAKSLIKVGTILQSVPSDEDLAKIIPKTKANTSAIKNTYKKNENVLKEHFTQLDLEILPAFHLSFDLWTDRNNEHHYIGIMAHEVNKETAEMEVYCLEMMDWDKVVALELGMSDID